MDSRDPGDAQRRWWLVQALAGGLFGTALVGRDALAADALGGRPAKLPPGQSIYRISGKVLPALAPALSYQHLTIQEGATASATWNQVVTGDCDVATIDRVRRDLLTYCALDTRAMVEIWRVLRDIVGDTRFT